LETLTSAQYPIARQLQYKSEHIQKIVEKCINEIFSAKNVRIWKNKEGKSLNGCLLARTETYIVICNTDKKIIEIPIGLLSDEDIDFLCSDAQEQAGE